MSHKYFSTDLAYVYLHKHVQVHMHIHIKLGQKNYLLFCI